MKNTHRVLLGFVGLAAISTSALAQNYRGNRNTCPPVVNTHRGHHSNSNFGFSINLGNSNAYRHGSFGNQWGNQWGHRGFSRSNYDRWGHTTYSRTSRGIGWHRPAVHQPVVVYQQPVYQQPVVRQPVVVERPVIIDRPVYQQPVTREIVREVPVYRESVVQDPRTRYNAGWSALKNGDFGYAREFFTDQAVRRPTDPTPKAGLALARAAAGLDDQAEWAMRRAVRAGFDRARQGLPQYDLERTLASLDERYEDRANAYNDRWFMLAATRYLLGDFAGAKDAANRALSFDERDSESRRIYDLVANTG